MKSVDFGKIENLNYGRREAINSLKTNMQFAGVDVSTVVVTSCYQGEGKTTISFDLARSLAESGKSVVFIDADMRRSQLIPRYRIENKGQVVGGLTHYLSGQANFEDIICTTNIDNLSLIMAGPVSSNPTELLSSRKCEVLLKTLGDTFDFVIIDSPPLGTVIDAAIIAPLTDGIIIVLEANSTPMKAAQNLERQIEVSGAKVLGYVLNKVNPKDGGYYGKYKYYGEKK